MSIASEVMEYAPFTLPNGEEVDGELVSYAGLREVVLADDEHNLPPLYLVEENEYGERIALLKGGSNLLPFIQRTASTDEYETVVRFLEKYPEITVANQSVVDMTEEYSQIEDDYIDEYSDDFYDDEPDEDNERNY